MRTNIEIDDALMERAFEYSGLLTKRAVVEEALRLLIRIEAGRRLLEMRQEGVAWEGDSDDEPADRPTPKAF